MNREPAKHSFLAFILPARAFAAVKAGTKQWLIECPCGHKQDYWDAGGVRYKGAGEPRRLGYCPSCGRNRMRKVRRKTESERREMP
jgi:DNA-directed RNA polymerase subunit RPC12/RpoP